MRGGTAQGGVHDLRARPVRLFVAPGPDENRECSHRCTAAPMRQVLFSGDDPLQ